jgi:CBS domain-containing protein
MKTCQDIMTKNPTCCLPSDKVYLVAQRMQSEGIGALPVVASHESNQLIGMITDRDLALRVVGASRDATSTTISDVMSPKPVSCLPLDKLDATVKLMAEHQIRRIPVVDENGQVVGIIAQADIATRLDDSKQLGQMVEQISQPDEVSAS